MLLDGLKENKMHLKTYFFVYNQRQTGSFRYIVLIYDAIGDFPMTHVYKEHNRKFHNLTTLQRGFP